MITDEKSNKIILGEKRPFANDLLVSAAFCYLCIRYIGILLYST